MSRIYTSFVRPLLFSRDSESAHHLTLAWLNRFAKVSLARSTFSALYGSPSLSTRVFGIDFPNPVGLAAGMDKFAEAVPIWPCLGFGFSELGGVTQHEQPGNPKPRMFRALAENALVNRMGFNNPGSDKMEAALQFWKNRRLWPQHPVGMNLGKSKITPLESASEDYVASFKKLESSVDFFVINVSSPNTPNLRQLQDKDALEEVLATVQNYNFGNSDLVNRPPKPVLVKIAPDLTYSALDDILEVTQRHRIAGIVATNTTIARPSTADPQSDQVFKEVGGLSGRPLRERSTEVIRYLWKSSGGKIPLVGVGGIFSVEDAWEKIRAGASLLEIYTGLVYEGPSLTSCIVRGLILKLREAGFKSLKEAVGSGC